MLRLQQPVLIGTERQAQCRVPTQNKECKEKGKGTQRNAIRAREAMRLRSTPSLQMRLSCAPVHSSRLLQSLSSWSCLYCSSSSSCLPCLCLSLSLSSLFFCAWLSSFYSSSWFSSLSSWSSWTSSSSVSPSYLPTPTLPSQSTCHTRGGRQQDEGDISRYASAGQSF